MRVSVETTGGLKRTAKIAVPSAEFEANVAVRLKAAAGDLKLPGFRPGKVPMKEVRRRLGPSARNQAASDMAIASFSEAMREQPFTLATQAQIEIVNLSPGADLEFTATFEVLPEVRLAPLDSLEVRRPRATIQEADIDFTIEEIRRQRREWIPAERPAQEGDRVVVDVVWKRGEDVLRKREGLMFVLEEQMNSLPKWKDALIGLAANATGRIATPIAALASEAEETEEAAAATDAALPLDEPAPATVVGGLEAEPDADEATSQPDPGAPLNENEGAAPGVQSDADGAAVPEATAPDAAASEHADEEPPATRAEAASESDLVAEFTVQSVEAPQMPAIDDALFDWFEVDAEGDRLAKFRAEVRERMEVELQAATRRATAQEVLAVLVAAHDFELPPTMAQAEAAAELQRLEAMFTDIPVEVAEHTAQVAKQRLRARLVVREIVSRHSLTPDDQRVSRRVDEIASAYEQTAEVRRALYRDENKMREIAAAVLEEQAVEHVLTQARVATVDMPYRDLVANQELPKRPAAAPPAARGGEDQDGAPTVAPAADASAENPGLLGKVKRLFAKQG